MGVWGVVRGDPSRLKVHEFTAQLFAIERMLRNICCAPWRPYPVSDGSSLASRLLGHGAFIFTSDGPVYRPPQLARGDGPSVPTATQVARTFGGCGH